MSNKVENFMRNYPVITIMIPISIIYILVIGVAVEKTGWFSFVFWECIISSIISCGLFVWLLNKCFKNLYKGE